jgi:hypothetical protein
LSPVEEQSKSVMLRMPDPKCSTLLDSDTPNTPSTLRLGLSFDHIRFRNSPTFQPDTSSHPDTESVPESSDNSTPLSIGSMHRNPLDKNSQRDTSSLTPNRSDNTNQRDTPDMLTRMKHLSTLNKFPEGTAS